MPDKFDTTLAPFNRLSHEQKNQLKASLDVVYFRHNDTILSANSPSEHLLIIIKGGVEETSEERGEIYAHYATDDMFDVRSQFEGTIKHNYYALEDTLCYLLPKEIFLQLYNDNGQFAAYFDNNLAKRQQLLEEAQQQQNLAEFILTQVGDENIQPALTVGWEVSLSQVTAQMKEHGVDAALVELNQYDTRLKNSKGITPFGIVTRTDLLHAAMLDKQPLHSPVGPIACYPVHHVEKGDFLFNAMIMMTRHKIKQVQVCDNTQSVGMLDLTQILSLFSTHSHVLALRISRAETIEELSLAANNQQNLVENLINNGIKTRFVMELIAAVNEQIIEKAFSLVVPPALQSQCCLVVLGSEGRGEQILKTDQDNALIINDGLQWHQCQSVMEKLTHTLQQLGYPLCPGNVMVNNSAWVKGQTEWKQEVSHLCQHVTSEGMMKLAILADAHAIAGDKSLLVPVKQHLHHQLNNQELVLTSFTRPALQFNVPLTLFGTLKSSKQGLDIKQGGIFPIVHGVRALALEHGIEQTNTFERLDQLSTQRVLEQSTTENLSEALKLFIKLRLHQQLKKKSSTNNQVNVKQLARTERDLLRHSLHVVKKFKEWLGYHYQIRD